MTLRIEVTLLSAHTIVRAGFNTELNRFVVSELLNPDPRLVSELRKQADKQGLAPSKEILEANAKTKGGTEELPWALLSNYSTLSERTQSIIRRSFAEIFSKISIEPDGFDIAHNQLSSAGRVRLYLGGDVYVWLDDIKPLSIFID